MLEDRIIVQDRGIDAGLAAFNGVGYNSGCGCGC